jgi:uncharacterized protein
VKIDIRQIPSEGLILTEQFNPSTLDLETDIIKLKGPVSVKAQVSKIINAVCVHLTLNVLLHSNCSRCLNELEIELKKDIDLDYQIEESQLYIDFDPDIREEIILDYPVKPLCMNGCKGLCPECGKNLNEGKCDC